MKVIALKFENYRNLKDNIITPCDGVNIIYGDNAQGKTNILEAVYVCCTTKSHRGAKDRDMIRFGEDESHIKLQIKGLQEPDDNRGEENDRKRPLQKILCLFPQKQRHTLDRR